MTEHKEPPKWKHTFALYWRWLVGGPRLLQKVSHLVVLAERAVNAAEEHERDNRREVFKSWSLVCAASDDTIIRIRPATFTLHVQGEVTQAVYDQLKIAWKESALLIRLPFPLTPTDGTFATVADWKIKGYESSSAS